MNINRIKAYIGFAKKSRTLVCGVDKVRERQVHLVIFSSELAPKAKQRCVSLEQSGVKVFEIQDEQMYQIIENPKVKAFGIENEELAKAIIKFLA